MSATFSDLIKEAFIDPIRSVLIIDDKYPTWEKIFSGEYEAEKAEKTEAKAEKAARWTPKQSILAVIEQFRKVSPALIVDIHDGVHNEHLGDYLHQSDLLVLDYELEPELVKGSRAKKIVSELLRNGHFNQIVIHTANTDLINPFQNLLSALLSPLNLPSEAHERGRALVEQFEESGLPDAENVLQALKTAVGLPEYFAYRLALLRGNTTSSFVSSAPELEGFRALARSAEWKARQEKQVFEYAIETHNDSLTEATSSKTTTWNPPGNGRHPWIRTDGAFIVFANKESANVLEVLREAIEDWQPSPSRLISSKIRAEISAQGAIAEDGALSDRRAYWQYYQELRQVVPSEETKNHRRTLLEENVLRHTERLFDLIGERTASYGMKVLETDPKECDQDDPGFSAYYSLRKEDEEKALDHYNAYISTKPVSGWHLQPGHIFKIDKELWVCLSPSCDLVPHQKSSVAVRGSKSAQTKPFLAVLLSRRNLKKEVKRIKATDPIDEEGLEDEKELIRKEINSGTLLYLQSKSGSNCSVETYSVLGGQGSGAPVWRLFLAPKFGKISVKDDKTADLNLSSLCGQDGTMKIVESQAQIIGQLRYEYALNLIQKLGVEFTRVGLGFSAHEK